MKRLSYYLMFLLGLSFSCQSDGDEMEPEETQNPTNPSLGPFEPYVSRFFEEAENHNVDLDRNQLDLAFMSSGSTLNEFCGYGWFDFNGTKRNRVEINPLPECWGERDDWEKENLMFHELGHAMLARLHDNWKAPNGLLGSIMCGGSQDGCNNFGMYNQHTPQLRAFYLKELFTLQPVLPPWMEKKTDSTLIYTESFEQSSGDWTYFETGEPSMQFSHSHDSLSANSSTGLILQGNPGSDINKVAGWRLTLPPLGLEETQSLLLKAKLIGDEVSGGGAEIVVQVDAGGAFNSLGYASTGGKEEIVGTFPSSSYELKIDYVPDQVSAIYILLVARPGTRGTLFFDDIELIQLK